MTRLGTWIAAVLGLAFGVLLCVLPAGQVALVAAGLVLLLVLLQYPLLGLLLFAGVATAIPYSTVQLGLRTTLSEALLGLTWLGVLWQAFLGRYQGKLRWLATERALLTLMLFSALPFVVGELVIAAPGSGLVNWIRWLLNLSVLFLVPLLLPDERSRDRLLVALLLGNLVMLVVSIGYFLKDRNALSMLPLLTTLKYAHPEAVQDIFSGNYTRMASPWVHPNLTGGALALFIPLALFYGWVRQGWRRWLGFGVALLGCAGLLLSISRGAILALALVLLWLSARKVPYSGRIVGLAVMFGLLLVACYPPLQERLATMFSSTNASTEIRLDEYTRFPEAMAAYPLGIGFKVDPPVPGSGLLGISNLWLNYIYKVGVPGLLLFVLVTWRWWCETRPRGPIPLVTRDNALWLGSGCGVAAALLTGFFDHYFSFTNVLVALFWLLLALNLQQARAHPEFAGSQTSPRTNLS